MTTPLFRCSFNPTFLIFEVIGERAKQARHSQVCLIEVRDMYMHVYVIFALSPLAHLITRKEGVLFEIAARTLCLRASFD